MATPTKLVTYEEWLEMPEAEGIEEVVNGEIITMPPARPTHSRIVHTLDVSFGMQLQGKRVDIFVGSFGIIIRRDPLTSRNPDLAIYKRESLIEADAYLHSAPELVIEVLSPTERRGQIEAKLRDYEELGAAEVWLVSHEAETIEVLQHENGRLVRKGIHADGQLRPLHFPEAAIDIASIWPR